MDIDQKNRKTRKTSANKRPSTQEPNLEVGSRYVTETELQALRQELRNPHLRRKPQHSHSGLVADFLYRLLILELVVVFAVFACGQFMLLALIAGFGHVTPHDAAVWAAAHVNWMWPIGGGAAVWAARAARAFGR